MAERRHPNVINTDEVEVTEQKKGTFHARNRRLGPHAGNAQLGATLTELPPGTMSYPFHYHCANEEAIFIVSGTGTARIGDARVAVRAGDWIALPVGPEHAHQMINDGEEPLRYLCVSTKHICEVVGYPDSKKVAAWAGPVPTKPWIRQIVREGETLDYWDSEPGAQ
ncbi:MAG TPA: cupin domain-containing protein [Kofleriaceae bacterium]|nr:cupin domain-containing protein [Kofleriaceae bacterium]